MSESQLFSNFQFDYELETPCFGQRAGKECKSFERSCEQQTRQDFINRSQQLQISEDNYASTTLQQSFTDLSIAERANYRQIYLDRNTTIRGSYMFNETIVVQQNQLNKANKILLSDERFKVCCFKNNLQKERLRVKPLKYWLGQTKRTLKNDGVQILKRLSVCEAITGLYQCNSIHSSTYLQRNQKLFGCITINPHSQIKIKSSLYGISKIRSDFFCLTIQDEILVISKFGQKQFNIFRNHFSGIRNDLSTKAKLKITLFKIESPKQQP